MARTGRPPKQYVLTNGLVSADDLFLFTPQNTIPGVELNRFLELCDRMIKEMQVEELTSSDIDAVAQYNKLRMFDDMICESMSGHGKDKKNSKDKDCKDGDDEEETQKFTDLGFITQLEKLSKQRDKHLENLKFRRKDRFSGKMASGGKSLSELARDLDAESGQGGRIDQLKEKHQTEIDIFEENFEDADPSVFIDRMDVPKE